MNSQLEKDTFDNRIIITLSEWGFIQEKLEKEEEQRLEIIRLESRLEDCIAFDINIPPPKSKKTFKL